MKIPSADEISKKFFKELVPNDPRVTIRPMFGNVSAFVNGNMFFGLFGNELFIRLPEEDSKEFLKKSGASFMEPMKGRPMKEYVIVPKAWWKQPETIRPWITQSLGWAGQLPAKKPKKK